MNYLQKILSNLPGWHTRRRIVVIESDDWGSIRMPSLKCYEQLKKLGLNVSSGDNQRFNTLDTLASADDFEMLFSTLKKFRDQKGNHPIITAMAVCANPDFEQIKQASFQQYFYEPFPSTLERYGYAGAFSYWKQGEQERLFYPEFHGREHLNVKVWMDDLQSGNKSTLHAFECGFWGFRNKNHSGVSYQAAFDLDEKKTIQFQKEVIESGLKLFEKLHARRASYFVPPNSAINEEIIHYASENGIKYVCSPKIHHEPQGNGEVKKRYRYLGKRGKGELIYITRNCFFEPSFKGDGFGISDCLRDIESAFTFRKPAIISTHRVNYVGGLQEANRKEGNEALGVLVSNILKKWPDVEFMTSSELADIIRHDKK